MRKVIWGAVVLVLLIAASACGLGAEARQRESTAYGVRVSEQWEAKKKADAERKDAADRAASEPERERKQAFTRRALAAVDLDGHPKGKDILKAIATCEDGFTRKCDHRWVAKDVSKVVYLAGMALREADPAKAEKLMLEAEKLAQEKAADRAAVADRLKREDEGIQNDLKACAADRSPCLDRCKKETTSTACVALGIYVVSTETKEDRYDRALAFFDAPCNAGMKAACDASKKATKERDELLRPVNDAWANLKIIGDDLATKTFLHRVASQNFKGARNARATANMATHIQALTKDYCIAAKEFLAVSTRTELAKRAKSHCTDDPPTATGLGGTEETLTAECKAVYATPCS